MGKGWKRVLVALGLGLVLLTAAAWESSAIPHYQSECRYNPETAEQECASYHTTFYVLWEVSKFIDDHNGTFSALFAGVVALFTWRLWSSTDKLWAAGEKQIAAMQEIATKQDQRTEESIKLARDEFLSAHRPRIILREAVTGSVLEGKPIVVYFTISNIGETAGTIIRSTVNVALVASEQLLLTGSTVELHDDLGLVELEPGTWTTQKFHKETPKWEGERFKVRTPPAATGRAPYREAQIHFYGQFLYKDQLGISRRTAFRRVLMPERQRFYRIPDEPDIDYND